MSQKNTLYTTIAKHYDQIYHWKDYQKEALKIKKLVTRHSRFKAKTLLDVACGTGKHIQYLQDDFKCVGVDVSEQMLAVARKNVPTAEFVLGNMVDFDLGREFDVVLCLFSSIGYLRTRNTIKRALANFARHMTKGGVLIIEPWIRKSMWRDRIVDLQTFDGEPVKIARVNFGRAEGDFSILDERYLIAEKGKGISYLTDRHKIRFFEPEFTLEAMKSAGLEPRLTKQSLMRGRGLLIATKN
ncbi:MAG: class I SAM-dependent methyltransferase [Nitrososphaerota archaeon]|nr:class I SAM-dependent methyltransferase [Nitrososphaerota archaeon]MDG7000795.1 class I SAM-dependent methyltransferase [Nitrososphaerota archaeon]